MTTINRKIKTFLNKPWSLGQKIMEKTCWLWPDAFYLRLYYFFVTKKILHLNNPKLFSEKLQWLKLYNRRPEYTIMVDKVSVKDFVSRIIGVEYVVPTLKVCESINDIHLADLPSKFVIKTSHGGGSCGVFICKDKSKFDLVQVKKQLNKALMQDCYRETGEWPYKNVKKRIIIEEYIEHFVDLIDYKFFCFNGRVEYCQVISGRELNMCVDFFDRNWKHQDFQEPAEYQFSSESLKCPPYYDKMIFLAEKLAVNIPFVRIDFYNVEGKIIFGEITFFPTAGFGEFNPEVWDRKFGDLIVLPSIYEH